MIILAGFYNFVFAVKGLFSLLVQDIVFVVVFFCKLDIPFNLQVTHLDGCRI